MFPETAQVVEYEIQDGGLRSCHWKRRKEPRK